MRVYTYGDSNRPSIFLLPGMCFHYETNFKEVIPLLTDHFFVYCVSYDGFDETEDTVFNSLTEEAEKIEAYINQYCHGEVDVMYGCSMGGHILTTILSRRNIHIKHAILGSSDLALDNIIAAKAKAAVLAKVIYGALQSGKIPELALNEIHKQPAGDMQYYDRLMEVYGLSDGKMKFVKEKSIYNQYYSELTTPIEEGIDIPGTSIHIFFASRMGEDVLARYHKYFKQPNIITHDLLHEELLLSKPNEWVRCVMDCCNH